MGKSHGTVTQTEFELAQCKNVIPYDCTHNCTPFPKKTGFREGGTGRMSFQQKIIHMSTVEKSRTTVSLLRLNS